MQLIQLERNDWNFFYPANFSISWRLSLLPLALALGVLITAAQQPVQPLLKVGSCSLGCYSSGSYCVPSCSGNTRGALEEIGGSYPLGFYSSGSYCVSSSSNNRQAIPKQGATACRAVESRGGLSACDVRPFIGSGAMRVASERSRPDVIYL